MGTVGKLDTVSRMRAGLTPKGNPAGYDSTGQCCEVWVTNCRIMAVRKKANYDGYSVGKGLNIRSEIWKRTPKPSRGASRPTAWCNGRRTGLPWTRKGLVVLPSGLPNGASWPRSSAFSVGSTVLHLVAGTVYDAAWHGVGVLAVLQHTGPVHPNVAHSHRQDL